MGIEEAGNETMPTCNMSGQRMHLSSTHNSTLASAHVLLYGKKMRWKSNGTEIKRTCQTDQKR